MHSCPPEPHCHDRQTGPDRRLFAKAFALWVATAGHSPAQTRSNIVELQGEVLLNGQRLMPHQFIQTGDSLETGPDSYVVFAIGQVAIQMRPRSLLAIGRGATFSTVSQLHLLKGGVLSLWGQAASSRLVTPALTATIRQGAVYTEVLESQPQRTYLCHCHGVMEITTAGQDKVALATTDHHAFWIDPQNPDNAPLTPAPWIKHTGDELALLARLTGQKPTRPPRDKKGTVDHSSDWTKPGAYGTLD